MPSDEILKENIIDTAIHHRQHCDGETCNISLYFLKVLAEKAGLKFTEEEVKHFL